MSKKPQQITRAAKTSQATKKSIIKRKHKIHNKLRFFKPKTLTIASKPKYIRSTSSLKMPDKFDKFSVLINPINTQKASKLMTQRNTITFLINPKANKIQIKKAFHDIHQMKPRSINTLITPQGTKKAYIRLKPENQAVSFASKLGII